MAASPDPSEKAWPSFSKGYPNCTRPRLWPSRRSAPLDKRFPALGPSGTGLPRPAQTGTDSCPRPTSRAGIARAIAIAGIAAADRFRRNHLRSFGNRVWTSCTARHHPFIAAPCRSQCGGGGSLRSNRWNWRPATKRRFQNSQARHRRAAGIGVGTVGARGLLFGRAAKRCTSRIWPTKIPLIKSGKS